MSESLRLLSDFRDFYDHRFAGSWRADLPVWRRYSTTTRTREQDHDLLEGAGLRVPELRGRLDSLWGHAVAYVDPCAHRGEGKRMGLADDLERGGVPGSTYAVPLLGEPTARGRSLRLVAAGRLYLWLTYRQRDPAEWRSNVGDVEIAWGETSGVRFERRAMDAAHRLQAELHEPLVAIDWVDCFGDWVAVDLNTAPGLAGTPIDRLHERTPVPGLSAADVADSIAARWREVHA